MKLTVKLIASITAVTVFIIVASTNIFWTKQKEILLQQAHAQAKTLFEMIVVTRQWVAENRDTIQPVPAVATKQLSEYARTMTDFRFHITSDMLINPDNAPDDFEKKAMAEFRKDAREYSTITTEKNKSFYRYMAPLYVNNACLECHEYQGYKVGDLRGGISIMLPLEDIEKALAVNNRNYFIIAILSFLGIVFTITMLLKAVVLKNIGILTTAAQSYKTGDFSKEIEIRTGDEIEELAEAFEVMRSNILENEDNLKNELAKVTESYNTVMTELTEKNKELSTVNVFKTDILDSLSHELRTPLTKIIAYSNLLMTQDMESQPEVKNKSLDAINRSAKLLNTLFNEIITLSRLDSKQYPYHFIPVELKKMTDEILQVYEKEISDKKLGVFIEIPEGTSLCLDGESFRHVVTNIISNSIKFSKNEGMLAIRFKESDEHNIIEFEDSGVGIPADEISKVTQRFYRGSNTKREFSGTGLGLSIVQRIMDGHSGRIEIHSEINKGTLFRLMVPKYLECSTTLESPLEEEYK